MTTDVFTRRAALLSLGSFVAAGLGGCDTTPTAGVQRRRPPGLRIGAVDIDDAALVAYVGNPTAQWAQQALPGALAQAFGARMAPGDPAPCRSTSASTRSISAAAAPPIPTG